MSGQTQSVVEWARTLVERKSYREAVGVVAPWLKDHPEDIAALEVLGAAEAGLRDWVSAEDAARRVVEASPDSARAWCNWGKALRKLDRLAEAREAQQHALNLEPDHARARVELGKLDAAASPLPPVTQPSGEAPAAPALGGQAPTVSPTAHGDARAQAKWQAIGLAGAFLLCLLMLRGACAGPVTQHGAPSAGPGQVGASAAPSAPPTQTALPASAPAATPDASQTPFDRGLDLYRVGNYEEALREFEVARSEGYANVDTWEQYCREGLQQRQDTKENDEAAAERAKRPEPLKGTYPVQTYSAPSPEPAAPPSLGPHVVSFGWSHGDYGTRHIVGTVVNDSPRQLAYVQVEFNLYDRSGTQVGSTFANVNNLEPGGRWRFEALVMEDSAKVARLKGVTGF